MMYTNEAYRHADFCIKRWLAVFGVMNEHCRIDQENVSERVYFFQVTLSYSTTQLSLCKTLFPEEL